MTDPFARRDLPTAPAAERNQEALTAVLDDWLPPRGAVLEAASGTGQHAAHWARRFPGIDWQPSDVAAAALASIDAWRRQAACTNLAPPLRLDVGDPAWIETAPGPWAVILAVNLLHISPWPTTCALLAGAAVVLAPAGRLLVYGPFAEDGRLEPASNVAFDAWLKREDPAWGVRDIRDIDEVARGHGLTVAGQIAMPANNRVLVVERAA